MSKITVSIRHRSIKKRQARRAKVNKLRERYNQSTGDAKKKILAKALMINPNLTADQFLIKANRQASLGGFWLVRYNYS